MVEMLGVLAVIGILSVAGISAYSSAMDKHRANTLINEAQKRAVVVAGQINMNDIPPTLVEFTNNDLGFDSTVYTKANLASMPEGQFGIQVSGVKKSICQNILNAIGDKTVIRRLSTTEAPTTALATCNDDNTFLMVYNNDMSTGANPCDNVSCGTGAICNTSECVCTNGNMYLSYNIGEECGTSTQINNKACTWDSNCRDTGGFCCVNNICMVADRYQSGKICSDKPCIKNTDCTSEYFCAFGSVANDNEKPDAGACHLLRNIQEKEFNGRTFYYNTDYPMSWWSAENWCKRNGFRLAKLSDFVGTVDNCSMGECIDWNLMRTNFGNFNFWLDGPDGFSMLITNRRCGTVGRQNQGVAPICVKK